MAEVLTLTYDLRDLPTSQHRAGLAGLLVVLDTMRRRGLANTPDWTIDDASRATVRLSQEGLAALFDELYAAKLVNDANATDTWEKVTPCGAFLSALGMPEPWLKLWRDVVWSKIRGIPRTRIPYEKRARAERTSDASESWRELERWSSARESGRHVIGKVSSALFVGAQETNAEQIPFVGRPNETLLLHFWHVVMSVGEVRRVVLRDKRVGEDVVGHALAIPDVSDLDDFVWEFRERAQNLDTRMADYVPRGAVLALPEEGALSYLHQLLAMARARATCGELRFTVAGIEVFVLAKRGNSIPIIASGLVPANVELVERYDRIVERYLNLLFRSQLIRNLLLDRAPHTGFDRIFSLYEDDIFVGDASRSFADDACRYFTASRSSQRKHQ